MTEREAMIIIGFFILEYAPEEEPTEVLKAWDIMKAGVEELEQLRKTFGIR